MDLSSDLSPVKSGDDDSNSVTSKNDLSAIFDALFNTSAFFSPTAMGRSESLSLEGFFDDDTSFHLFSHKDAAPEAGLLGLTLMNLNCDFDAPQSFSLHGLLESPVDGPYFPQISFGQDMSQPAFAPPNISPVCTFRRARPITAAPRRRSAGGLQFNACRDCKSAATSHRMPKRCFSEPEVPTGTL